MRSFDWRTFALQAAVSIEAIAVFVILGLLAAEGMAWAR